LGAFIDVLGAFIDVLGAFIDVLGAFIDVLGSSTEKKRQGERGAGKAEPKEREKGRDCVYLDDVCECLDDALGSWTHVDW